MKKPLFPREPPVLIAVLLGLFTLGMICGWLAKSFSGPDAVPQEGPVAAFAAADEAVSATSDDANRASTEPGDFFSRVHSAVSSRGQARRERALRAVADDLDASEVQEALARLEKLRIPHRETIIAQLFARWGEIDPEAAIEAAWNVSTSATQQAAVAAVLGAWIESDAASAERWVAALPDGLLKNSAWRSLISGVAVGDPKRALSLLQEQDLNSSDTYKMVRSIFPGWISTNAKEAAEHAMELPEGDLRMRALRTVAEEWGWINLPEALAWAESVPGQKFQPVRLGSHGLDPIYGVLGAWVQKDSSGAVNWLAQLPDGEKKAALGTSACTFLNFSSSSPQVAMQLTMLLPPGPLRDDALQRFAHTNARWTPAAALDWVRRENDPHHRAVILSGLLSHLSGKHLLDALEFARSLDPSSREDIISIQSKDDGGRTMWSLADPVTLAAWAERQPDNQGYLNNIAASWARRDAVRAGEWLQTLPAPKRDAALEGILKEAIFRVPVDNFVAHFQNTERWILHLSSAAERESAYEKLGKRWMEMDADSARAWIRVAPHSTAARERLLK